MPVRVQDHYGSADIVTRILAAVPWSAAKNAPLTADQLFLSPPKDAHLLDIGSGIGGPARYFASVFGCRVTGVDLTPQFVAAATDLTRLAGLATKVDFIESDAADMPFAPDSFDHAYCFYVGMNLPDRPAVMRECFRVLKPGAALLWTEVTSNPGTPHYPLPWARSAADSHVDTRDLLNSHILEAGFELLSSDDETGLHLELARRNRAAGAGPTAGQIHANELVLGADFIERRTNYIRSLADGALASTAVHARKPPELHAS